VQFTPTITEFESCALYFWESTAVFLQTTQCPIKISSQQTFTTSNKYNSNTHSMKVSHYRMNMQNYENKLMTHTEYRISILIYSHIHLFSCHKMTFIWWSIIKIDTNKSSVSSWKRRT